MKTALSTIRLYSLVDLALLLAVAHPSGPVFLGSISLWLGFLFFLEFRHAHPYRGKVSSLAWIPFSIIGLIAYGRIEGLLFLFFSYLYSLKNVGRLGLVSPFFTAASQFFLIAGIVGYQSFLPWLVLGLVFLRNALGDVRDAGKDSSDGSQTLPILLGYRKNSLHIHLVAIWVTTFVWWWLGDFNVIILIVAWVVEGATYGLTPRNLTANSSLQEAL